MKLKKKQNDALLILFFVTRRGGRETKKDFPINSEAKNVHLLGLRSTRFRGAIRNICATTFNQLLGLAALMLLNYRRPRSSRINHLLLLPETQDTCFHLLVYFQVITALASTRPRAYAILLAAVSSSITLIHNLYYLVSSAKYTYLKKVYFGLAFWGLFMAPFETFPNSSNKIQRAMKIDGGLNGVFCYVSGIDKGGKLCPKMLERQSLGTKWLKEGEEKYVEIY